MAIYVRHTPAGPQSTGGGLVAGTVGMTGSFEVMDATVGAVVGLMVGTVGTRVVGTVTVGVGNVPGSVGGVKGGSVTVGSVVTMGTRVVGVGVGLVSLAGLSVPVDSVPMIGVVRIVCLLVTMGTRVYGMYTVGVGNETGSVGGVKGGSVTVGSVVAMGTRIVGVDVGLVGLVGLGVPVGPVGMIGVV